MHEKLQDKYIYYNTAYWWFCTAEQSRNLMQFTLAFSN